MTDKGKPTEAEVQEWLDGVHFSSSCNLSLASSNNKDKAEQASKYSPKKDHSASVVKSEG